MKTGKYKIVPPPVDEAAIHHQYATAARARQARRVTLGRGLPPGPELAFYKDNPEEGLTWEWDGENPAVWDIMLALDEAGEAMISVLQLPGTDRVLDWSSITDSEEPLPSAGLGADGVYQMVGRDVGGTAVTGASKKVPKTPVKLKLNCATGLEWQWRYKDPYQWAIYVTTIGSPPVTGLVATVPGNVRAYGFDPAMGGEYHVIGLDENGHMAVRPSKKILSLCRVAPSDGEPFSQDGYKTWVVLWMWPEEYPEPAYWRVGNVKFPGTARTTYPKTFSLATPVPIVGLDLDGNEITGVGHSIQYP